MNLAGMDRGTMRQARNGEPSIDRIDIGESATAEEQREWLMARAPVFVRKLG